MSLQKILILAPHTDDAELGCGGTIARMLEESRDIYVAAFSTAEESLPPGMPPDTLKIEFQDAMQQIGVPESNLYIYDYPVRRLSYYRQDVLEELVSLRQKISPDLIMLPSKNDLHQDHHVVHMEGLRAFKDLSIFAYELPWNHIDFSAQGFVILNRNHIEAKYRSLQSYKSQLALSRNYFTMEFIEGLARLRGTQVKSAYAEAFEVMRIKL